MSHAPTASTAARPDVCLVVEEVIGITGIGICICICICIGASVIIGGALCVLGAIVSHTSLPAHPFSLHNRAPHSSRGRELSNLHRRRSQIAILDHDGDPPVSKRILTGREIIREPLSDHEGTHVALEATTAGNGWPSCSRPPALTCTSRTPSGLELAPPE